MNTISSRIISAIALLANAVSVDGGCTQEVDGYGATIGDIVLKEDADSVVKIPANRTAIPGGVSVSSLPYPALAAFCPSHDPNYTSFSFSIGV